jgi:hypothetical protein
LAHAFLWEYSYKTLKLAQLLGQLGVFLTSDCSSFDITPVSTARSAVAMAVAVAAGAAAAAADVATAKLASTLATLAAPT